jgi:hypothetical protein
MDGMVKEAEQAAQTMAMQLQFVPANSPEEITGTFSTIGRDRADALCVFPSPMLFAVPQLHGRLRHSPRMRANRSSRTAARMAIRIGYLRLRRSWFN